MNHSDTHLSDNHNTADEALTPLQAARRALYRWADVVSRGQIDDVLALYASDAILVPTLSNEIRERDEERRRYFEMFMADGIPQCTIDRENSRISRKHSTVVIGGLYSFRFERKAGEETVRARFLFTFEQIDGPWLITGHHSSRLTETV